MTEDTKLILGKIEEVNRKVTSIELTIENEVSKNIMTVAEGHLDLSRKLDEADYKIYARV